MNWIGKKVLVTGAGGFIGSHLVENLVRLGASVTALVRYNSKGSWGSLGNLDKKILSEIKIELGDIKDPYAVQSLVKGKEIIFHLAALIGIPYSYVHPINYVQTNIVGTSYLLSACLSENIEKFIHTSTSEVYGTAKYVPIDEGHPLQAQSPYSASKIAADKMAESYFSTFRLPVAIIRPFNTYGPRQPTRSVIPTIISQVLKSNKVKLGSLTPTRDLNFVEDTVNGFLRIAEVPESNGEIINIGSSKEISVGDLATKIFDLLGKKPELLIEEHRIRPETSEVERLLANTEKARNLLNWSPKISLTDGLTKTIEWIQQNLNLFTVDSYHI